MELTLENLVNYIVEKENEEFLDVGNIKRVLGENHPAFLRKRARWNVYYEIAQEFGFVDKLKTT